MMFSIDSSATQALIRNLGTIAAQASLAIVFSGFASAAPCMDDAFGSPTTCNANDFGVASIMVTAIDDDGCQAIGDTVTFDAMLSVVGSKSNRYDVGFYLASDSIQARSGQCTVAVIPPGLSNADDGDACGDFDGEPFSVPVTDVTVDCVDSDGDAFFDIVLCASYSQSSNSDCADASQAVPGTSSKCNCQLVMTEEPVPPCETNADCVDDGNPCTDAVCNAPQSGIGDSSGCSHEANTAPCDDGLHCNGADACSQGSCTHEGNPCTLCVDSCNEETDSCQPLADAEACADRSICRGPRYWSSRAGYEGDEPVNVVQEVLGATVGVEVCGRWIDATCNSEDPYLEGLGLSSALQGLCVRPKNVKQRRLDRQLVATALNCTISGRDDCDAFVLGKVDVAFSTCNDVCAGLDAGPDAPSVSECIDQLACFNDGGEIVDGKCALGTCRTDTNLYCGGDYDRCPDVEGQPQPCGKFDGNCREQALCNEALGVCPMRTGKSSKLACREATRDDCTVDSCP